MRAPRLIAVPFHDGLAGVDRGLGPGALLAAAGVSASETVAAPDPGEPEAARVFAVAARLAARVNDAHGDGAFPLVLAGDCNSCLGTVAGCPADGLGAVWLDAHADFDTAADSASGSLDATARIAGRRLGLAPASTSTAALRQRVGRSGGSRGVSATRCELISDTEIKSQRSPRTVRFADWLRVASSSDANWQRAARHASRTAGPGRTRRRRCCS